MDSAREGPNDEKSENSLDIQRQININFRSTVQTMEEVSSKLSGEGPRMFCAPIDRAIGLRFTGGCCSWGYVDAALLHCQECFAIQMFIP